MSVESIFFDKHKYDWTREVPETVIIPKGSTVRILECNNYDTYGDLSWHKVDNIYKQSTLKCVGYARHYVEYAYDGSVAASADDVYIVTGPLNDLWKNDYDFTFCGIIDAKTVSGGGKSPL